jgi:signal transduction histidine kinase
VRPLRVQEVVRQAVSYLPPADVQLEIDPELVLSADPERLEQIVVNLVGNGLRHGEPPVTVRTTTDGCTARLEVRDHGQGVPGLARSRLFTQFSADGADSVGLGLWIVGKLAQAHGGEAHYEDADPGARMVVTWPTTTPSRS